MYAYESEGIDLLRHKNIFLVDMNKLAYISEEILQETQSSILYSVNMKCYYSSQNINSDDGRLCFHMKIISITLLFLFVYNIFLRIGCKLRVYILKAGPTGRAVKGIVLRSLAYFVVGSHSVGCLAVCVFRVLFVVR